VWNSTVRVLPPGMAATASSEARGVGVGVALPGLGQDSVESAVGECSVHGDRSWLTSARYPIGIMARIFFDSAMLRAV